MKSQSNLGMRIVSTQKILLCLLLAALPIVSSFAATIALDNTDDGLLPLGSISGTPLTDNGAARKAVIFSTPLETSVFLTDFRFAFGQVTAGPTLNLRVDLMAANGDNIPTGPVLATLAWSPSIMTP